eukprot:450879-Pelagomonas_calceolata.AAC.2
MKTFFRGSQHVLILALWLWLTTGCCPRLPRPLLLSIGGAALGHQGLSEQDHVRRMEGFAQDAYARATQEQNRADGSSPSRANLMPLPPQGVSGTHPTSWLPSFASLNVSTCWEASILSGSTSSNSQHVLPGWGLLVGKRRCLNQACVH